jgi:hypothetical protein
MIHELRYYEITPGRLADYLKLSGEIAIPLRGDRYGKLLGFWFGEVGAANTALNLWQHENLNTRETLRAELQAMEAWRTQYIARTHPLVQQQFSRVMTPVVPCSAPRAPGNIYEVRFIRTKTGKAHAVASWLASEVGASGYAVTVGIWTTSIGYINEVVHIAAYSDIRERMTRSLQHPDSRRFLKECAPLVDEVRSTLMLPADHSPLR